MCKIVESDLFTQPDCRDVLLPLVNDQLSGQLDDHSSKPDYEACIQLLSTVLDTLDRKDDFLMETFIMFKDLMGNVFPADWMVMNLVQMQVFLRAINQYSNVLNKLFLDQAHFELQIWRHEEDYGFQDQRYVVQHRQHIAFSSHAVIFLRDNICRPLGPHKMKFIPSMVGPILEVTLVPEPELRKDTIPIFFDMMQLLEHCRRHRYLSQSGEELALLLSSLLENLLAYRTITLDESPEHRMSCTVNVLVSFKPVAHAHWMRVKGMLK
ncbi:hypothetical protein GOODEAATRI_020243 [Goodea atripinnis]|uniref:Dedicator of cytokinesis TPR repeats region domain-containing protein n=1 Tax=Goodea atripinnis TaxID=208336 RepID=A0ABV0ND44_9TELE